MTPSAALAQRLRERGLRLTSQRLAVLAAIEAGVLDDLAEAGLIRRIEPAGRPARYAGAPRRIVVLRSAEFRCGTDPYPVREAAL